MNFMMMKADITYRVKRIQYFAGEHCTAFFVENNNLLSLARRSLNLPSCHKALSAKVNV